MPVSGGGLILQYPVELGNVELREDGGIELREDGNPETRDAP